MPSLDAGIRIVGFSNSRPLGVYDTFRLWPGRAKHRRLKSPSRKKRRKSPEDGPRGASSSKAKPGKKSPKSGKKPKGKGKKARKSKA